MLTFTKMNGAGNDFVMIDNRDGSRALDKAQIARLCDRHRGVGADGLLALEPAQDGADFRMRTTMPTAARRKCAATARVASRASRKR